MLWSDSSEIGRNEGSCSKYFRDWIKIWWGYHQGFICVHPDQHIYKQALRYSCQ